MIGKVAVLTRPEASLRAVSPRAIPTRLCDSACKTVERQIARHRIDFMTVVRQDDKVDWFAGRSALNLPKAALVWELVREAAWELAGAQVWEQLWALVGPQVWALGQAQEQQSVLELALIVAISILVPR